MNFLDKIWFQLRALFGKREMDEQLSAEIQTHVDLATEANVAKGMTPEEARYAALREFGNVASIQERARDEQGWLWLDQLGQDSRYAVRQLWKAKGFTAVVVLTLALGIGATTAIYSVVDRVLLNPVPGLASDRTIQIGEWTKFSNEKEPRPTRVGPVTRQALEEQREFFERHTWCDYGSLTWEKDGFTTGLDVALVPVDFFKFFDAAPFLGRSFATDETAFPANRDPLSPAQVRDGAIVLSYNWWQAEFGGDPAILGKILRLSGKNFTVIGVMPEHFSYPRNANKAWVAGEPLQPSPDTATVPWAIFLARLKPETSGEPVQAMLDTLANRLMQDHPAGTPYGEWWRMHPGGLKLWHAPLRLALQGEVYGRGFNDVRRTLGGFLAAIIFVLLIVCANTANLTLAGMERRRHELAIRAALGGSRGRLTRQLLTENLLLGLLGGGAGLVLAGWGIRLLASFNTLPQLRPIELDGRMLGVALLVSLLSGLAFGLLPAWQGGKTRVSERLQDGGLFATGGSRRSRFRRGLVVFEVALALVLLVGAGCMVQGVSRLLRVNPGYDPENLLNVRYDLMSMAMSKQETMNARRAEVIRRLTALPGVNAVGVLQDSVWQRALPDGRQEPLPLAASFSGLGEHDFLQVAGLRLLAGRHFRAEEAVPGATAVIVNDTLARLCWPGESALGKTIRLVDRENQPPLEVVGVVSDLRAGGYGEPLRPTFFRPVMHDFWPSFRDRLWLRSKTDPAMLVALVRDELKATGFLSGPPVINAMSQELFDSTLAARTFRNYMLIFAGTGLMLAALGIYGVLAYSVAARTREMGVRLALGANRRDITGLVVGEGMKLVGVGLAAGCAAGVLLNRVLQPYFAEPPPADAFVVSKSITFNLSPTDPVVLVGVVTVLAMIALVACWLPARRAAKVDPVIALRAE